MTPNAKVMIGTPAYGGMVHLGYVNSIKEYLEAGIDITVAGIANESLITRARNTLFSRFHHRPEYTHLLFLDGDVYLSADGLQRLLAHGVDVVGAAVSLKGSGPNGERLLNIGDALGEQGDLHEVTRIGTAALLLSRGAVDQLADEAVRSGRTYVPGVLGGSDASMPYFDVFRVGVEGNEYLSEDFWICSELRRLGTKIWCDPEVRTHHHGTHRF